MIRYQGENISFSLELEKLTASDTTNWSSFAGVVVYFYTHTSYIAKFRSGIASGYTTLKLDSNLKYLQGVLESEHTKQMNGALLMDVYVYNDTGVYKCIKSVTTGIQILYAPIKQEA